MASSALKGSVKVELHAGAEWTSGGGGGGAGGGGGGGMYVSM